MLKLLTPELIFKHQLKAEFNGVIMDANLVDNRLAHHARSLYLGLLHKKIPTRDTHQWSPIYSKRWAKLAPMKVF